MRDFCKARFSKRLTHLIPHLLLKLRPCLVKHWDLSFRPKHQSLLLRSDGWEWRCYYLVVWPARDKWVVACSLCTSPQEQKLRSLCAGCWKWSWRANYLLMLRHLTTWAGHEGVLALRDITIHNHTTSLGQDERTALTNLYEHWLQCVQGTRVPQLTWYSDDEINHHTNALHNTCDERSWVWVFDMHSDFCHNDRSKCRSALSSSMRESCIHRVAKISLHWNHTCFVVMCPQPKFRQNQ